MKCTNPFFPRGFTLLETVIAIGVLSVLLTGFLVVFTPAADGIRRSINSQQADRLTSTLERELVTIREADKSISSQGSSELLGFGKAFDWIKKSDQPSDAILIYQYRGSTLKLRGDGTSEPVASVVDKVAGKDFTIVSMARRQDDGEFSKDLAAVEGPVYLVKCNQLIFDDNELNPGEPGQINDPNKRGAAANSATEYPEAVIVFTADFYLMPSKDLGYFSGSVFNTKFENLKNPVFSRNLAIRR